MTRSLCVDTLPLCLLFAISLIGATSCSAAADGSPVDQCDALLDTYCAQVDTCGGMSQTQCMDTLSQHIDCARAARTTPSYDRCIDEVQAMSCEEGSRIPTSCDGAVELSGG